MLHEVSFKSFNERDTVYGWIYVPACEPKGIVQLIHGFGEHSRRYFHLIVRLMEAGYIVAADDHVGHGKTALENNTWGDWGNQGFHTMMEDEHQLKALVSELYPNLPYFLYGHSMGSMIARDFMTKYGEELTGEIIENEKGEIHMSDCLFCKIAAGEIPSTKVYEDETTLAFRDINPQAPTHVLILPKKHMKNVLECDGETAAALVNAVKKVAKIEKVDADGFRIISNCGENGAQSVPHLHVHLLGGKKLSDHMD